jgi:hypothetical protein
MEAITTRVAVPISRTEKAMPKLEVVLAFTFGVIFVAVLLVIALFVPDPTPQQFEIFRIVIAIAVAGIAAAVPGLLRLTISQGSKLALQAGGALAVFVVVYFYSPARWAAEEAGAVSTTQQTSGPGSPAISDVNGNVTTISE